MRKGVVIKNDPFCPMIFGEEVLIVPKSKHEKRWGFLSQSSTPCLIVVRANEGKTQYGINADCVELKRKGVTHE